MKCTRFRKSIDRYMDHELSPAEQRAAVQHLEDCPACSAEVESLESVRQGLFAFEVAEPPPALVGDIMRAVDRPAPARPFGSWLLWPAAAAASMAAIALGYGVGAGVVALDPHRADQSPANADVPVAELRLEEPFTLFPGAEETLVLLGFNGETEGKR